MTLEKTISDLKKGRIAPCYLLFGDEEYLLEEALGQILETLVPPRDRDFGLIQVDGENADFDLLKDHLMSPSLLGGGKVVVVKNSTLFQSRDNVSDLIRKIRAHLDADPEKAIGGFRAFLKITGFVWEDLAGNGWQKITDEQWQSAVDGDSGEDRHLWLPKVIELCAGRGGGTQRAADVSEQFETLFAAGLPAGNCLILTADVVDKRTKIFKVIEKIGIVLHFSAAKGEKAAKESFKAEAQKQLARVGKTLTEGAWTALGRKTGYQLRSSLNELQKLIFYVGERPVIEEADVEEVVGKTKDDSIFDLTNALAEKNAAAALTALKALLDQGEHHLMILAMITREIRMITHASVLISSGKLPNIKPSMDFAWFQKNVYPVVARISESFSPKDDVLMRKHPYVIFNALRNCGRFSYPVLTAYLDDLVDIDREMKSSVTDPRWLLERFLVKACTL
jgi:DNA polymerase-3 subunit delta